MRSRHGILAFAVGMLLVPGSVHAQKVTPQGSNAKRDPATCHIEGVWQLESMNWGGQDQPQAGRTEHKMVSNGHFMWIGEEKRRDTIALHTQIDSMRAQLVTGGYGTPPSCTGSCPDGSKPGYYVTLSASLTYTSVMPYSILGSSATLSSQAVVRVE